MRGAVPEEDLERTAAAVFDSAAQKVSDVVSVELELSSELQTKHGAVVDSMQRAIKQAVDESGAFTDVNEDTLAEYVVDTSKLFADQVLAEATQRNVPIEEVVKASDIVYENGGIRLKSQTKGDKSRVLADSSVNVEGEQAEKTDVSQEKLYQLPQKAYDAQGKADINTPEFKEWFGDSKVVDENGKPLVVYHGSPNKGIQIFDKNQIGNRDNGFFGKGFYFTPKDYVAEGYTNTNDIYPDFNNQGNEGEVYPVYLDVKNPKYVRDIAEGTIDTEELIQQGYDGIIVYSFEEYPESVRESDPYVKETIEEAKGYKNTWWQLKTFDDEVIGRKYIDEIVVFEPNQIKSVYNRGTWDARNDNIYYQRAYAGRTKNLFKPILTDVKKFAETLKKAIRGELKPQTMLQVVSSTPEVYKKLGVEDKALNLPQNVLRKINIGKHDVPLSVIEQLPELVSNPLVVLDSKTEKGSFVSILDAVDANGNTVVAVIKPTDRAYNVIPSVYGKEQISNLVESSNIRYVNNTEKPATASIDLSSLRLRGGDSARGNNTNILQKSDIVNSFMQQKPQPKGLYDAKKGVIKIFESADFSTLPHELAHYWLDNMWHYVRSGNASEKYRQRWNVIANWLNVKQEQAFLTRGQQEKFARGYEQYLLNGNLPTPIIKGAFDDYDRWLKRVYGDMNRLNVRHIDYKKKRPGAEREFNATLKATQIKPTFSRRDLGAGLNGFSIWQGKCQCRLSYGRSYKILDTNDLFC